MENRRIHIARRVIRYAICLAVLGLLCAPGAKAQSGVPKYKADPYWPKPLPDHWVLANIGGVCVDQQNHVFVLNRGNYTHNQLTAGEKAPPVLEFDSAGNLLNSWSNPKLADPDTFHGCRVDKQNHLWLISAYDGVVQEYTESGKLLFQIGKRGINYTHQGPLPGHKYKEDDSDHTTFYGLQGFAFDKKGNIYIAEGLTPVTNHRVTVFTHKGRFLRQWAVHRTPGESANWFPLLHCINVSASGNNVYVCDRQGDRILDYDSTGHLKRYVTIPLIQRTKSTSNKPVVFDGIAAGQYGTVVDLLLSTDPAQKYLIDLNEDDEEVVFLNRKTLKVVTSFGRVGTQMGEFTHMHFGMMDSKGDLYVGEVYGNRVDKYVPLNNNW